MTTSQQTEDFFRVLLDLLLDTIPHMDHTLHMVILINHIPQVDIRLQVILPQVAILQLDILPQVATLHLVTLLLVIMAHQLIIQDMDLAWDHC